MSALLKDREHLFRLAALAVAAVLVFVLLRVLFVPPGFGLYGHYRAGALDDNRAQTLVHAGQGACVDCHADADTARKAGRHARVTCEACHGPLARHADDNAVVPERPHARDACLHCHTANVAKPTGFPQVVPSQHAESGPCTDCHRAHNPGEAP